jgi:N-succinyl-L-ornithine transcarbamylase
MKQFVSVHDLPDLGQALTEARAFKQNPLLAAQAGAGKRVGLIFFNPSLRTRLSTQIAARNLGMDSIVLNAGQEGWQMEFADGAVMNGQSVEHIIDAAGVMGQYFDILCVRTFPTLNDKVVDYGEQVISQFIRHSVVPVVSLESATLHPLQSFADTITISEQMPVGRKPKVVLTWAPHIKAIPHCVANSFAQWMNHWEAVDLTITHPEGYELDEQFTRGAHITHNQAEALEGADFVYVKNWSSYHQYGSILTDGNGWMLTEDSLRHAPEARIMHCLPVRREVELAGALLDSGRSLVQQQAGNRVWAAQTVFHNILKNIQA